MSRSPADVLLVSLKMEIEANKGGLTKKFNQTFGGVFLAQSVDAGLDQFVNGTEMSPGDLLAQQAFGCGGGVDTLRQRPALFQRTLFQFKNGAMSVINLRSTDPDCEPDCFGKLI